MPNLEKLILDVHGVERPNKDAQHVTLGLKSLTVGWRSGWVSDHVKLVLRGSPLLRNLRCYCKYPIRASISVSTLVGKALYPDCSLADLGAAIIEGKLTSLFTLEIFARMKFLDPVIGLHSELDKLSTKALFSPSDPMRLQNLHLVLSELTSYFLNVPLLDKFLDLDRVLSHSGFRHLEKISIALAISSKDSDEEPEILRTREELEQLEKETCTAFSGTVAAHGVQICCDAVTLVMDDQADFWEIKRENETMAESVCIW